MQSRQRTAEEWIAEIDRIVYTYRTFHPQFSPARIRRSAIEELVELGLTEGDAIRYLDGSKSRRPPS